MYLPPSHPFQVRTRVVKQLRSWEGTAPRIREEATVGTWGFYQLRVAVHFPCSNPVCRRHPFERFPLQ